MSDDGLKVLVLENVWRTTLRAVHRRCVYVYLSFRGGTGCDTLGTGTGRGDLSDFLLLFNIIVV